MRFVILSIVLLILSACSFNPSSPSDSEETKNSTQVLTKEMLKENPAADFFVYKGRVYEKRNIVNDTIEKEEVGKISEEYKHEDELKEGEATKLPKGTIIFKEKNETSSDVLLIEINEKIYEYIGKSEG